MGDFAIIVLAAAAALALVFFVIGKYYPGSGAEQLDWHPTRSAGREAALEVEDTEQMLAASNARRRRSGRSELSEEKVAAQVQEAERERAERARAYREQYGGEEG
jgi:hypothetical protein